MKQYYKTIKNHNIEVWRGDNTRSYLLRQVAAFIIPLGTNKPKNVSRETIKEF